VACRLRTPAGAWAGRFLKYENPLFDVVLTVPERVLATTGNAVFDGGMPAEPNPDGGCAMPGPLPDGGAQLTAVTRVPQFGAAVTFQVIGGFFPLGFTMASDIAVQMPRMGRTGPDGITVYVADEGKQNVGTGLRGQIVRFYSDTQSNDSTFRVR
jgi:hypothetical protein